MVKGCKQILIEQGMTEQEAVTFIEGCKQGLQEISEGKVVPLSQLGPQ